MKTATVKQLKDELKLLSPADLMELTLRLSRFKKENKELLSYLLFEANNEELFVKECKEEIAQGFAEINASSIFFVKKAVRKILKATKKYIRYSNQKSTEVELLLYFCKELKSLKSHFNRSSILQGIFDTQLRMARKATEKLHEDLQYDYEMEIEKL